MTRRKGIRLLALLSLTAFGAWLGTTHRAGGATPQAPTDTLGAEIAFTVDGAGPELGAADHVAIAASSTGYLAAWLHRDGSAAPRLEIARVDALGRLRDARPTVVDATPIVGPIAVASDGTDFLVAWTDRRNTVPLADALVGDVYAARVTAEGVLRDAAGFPVAATPVVERAPSLAWANDGWWVTYESVAPSQIGVRAARLDAAGNPIRPPAWVTVAGPASLRHEPFVASRGDGALVVWSAPDVRAARLLGDGTVLPIAASLSGGNAGEHPTATWMGERWIVVWSEPKPVIPVEALAYDFRAVRLDAFGVIFDHLPITISSDFPGVAPDASVVWTGQSALVAWSERFVGRVARVSPLGEVALGGNMPLEMPLTDRHFVLAAPSPASAAGVVAPLVAFEREDAAWSPAPTTAWVKRLLPSGSPIEGEALLARGAGAQVHPTVAAAGDRFLVAWCDGAALASSGWDIRAALVDRTARYTPFSLSETRAGECAPAVAGGPRGTLGAWIDSRGAIWAARWDADGTSLDPFPLAIAPRGTIPDGIGPLSVAWNGTEWMVGWAAGGAPTVARVSIDGRPMDPEPFAFAPAQGVHQVALAGDGSDGFRAVWSEDETQIYTARLDLWGRAAKRDYLGQGTTPAVVADDTGHLVVWSERRQLDRQPWVEVRDLAAMHLDGKGLMDWRTSGLTGDAAATLPVLAKDEDGDVVAWRSSEGAIQAARIVDGGLGATLTLSATAIGGPSIAAGPDRLLLVAWTRADEAGGLRVFARFLDGNAAGAPETIPGKDYSHWSCSLAGARR